MPFEQDVKELAYTIDAPCWISYSGKPRWFKGAMDERRTASLKQAEQQIKRHKANASASAPYRDNAVAALAKMEHVGMIDANELHVIEDLEALDGEDLSAIITWLTIYKRSRG